MSAILIATKYRHLIRTEHGGEIFKIHCCFSYTDVLIRTQELQQGGNTDSFLCVDKSTLKHCLRKRRSVAQIHLIGLI